MTHLFCKILLLLVIVFFQGCEYRNKIHNIAKEKILNALIVDSTTKVEVYQALGNPWSVYQDKKKLALVYRYREKKDKATKNQIKQLVLIFDEKSVLKSYHFSVLDGMDQKFTQIP